jgi:hypothetical protein
MKLYTVDVITECLAKLLLREDEAVHVVVSVDQLPVGVQEGDIISAEISNNGHVIQAVIETKETAVQKEKVQKLLDKLKKKSK